MPDSLPIDIFHDSRTQTDNIGIDTNTKTSFDIYPSNWYLNDVNAGPFVRLSYFIGEDVNPKTEETKNIIKFTNNNKTQPYFLTPTSWSIGYGTPQCKWSVPNNYFVGNNQILRSGNGKAYNSTFEKVAFQVVRKVTPSGSTYGDVWLKTNIRMKPTGKVIPDLYMDSGIITTANPNIVVDCNFNDNVYNYLPEMLKYHYCKIEILQGSTVVRGPYYVKRGINVTKSGSTYNYVIVTTEWTLPLDVFNSLTAGVYYSIRVTPGVYYNNTFYSYSDRSTTVTNAFMRDPTPKTAGLTVTPGSIGTVRDFDKTTKSFTYNFNETNNGILNQLKFELSAPGESTITHTYSGSAAKHGTCTIDMKKLRLNKTYKLTAKLYYDQSLYSTKVISSSFITSSPTPLNTPVNTSGIVNPYRSETLTVSWSYDNSNFKTKGIANGYRVEFYNGGSLVANKDVNLSNQNTNSGGSCTFDTTVFPKGVNLTLKITPYFRATILGSTVTEFGTSPLTVNNFVCVDFGLDAITQNSPVNTFAEWFFGDTDINESAQFRIAFTLPEDKNYPYLSSADQTAYRYSSLIVTYSGDTTVSKTYTLSENSTEEDPTWICVSNTGELTHKNTVIIDLTGITVLPDTNDEYRITVSVTSPYGDTKTVEYTIKLNDFPLKLADNDASIDVGEFITKDSFDNFFETKRIVDTFIDPKNVVVITKPVKDELIKYDSLKNLVSPVNALYDITKDTTIWANNVKVYKTPRAIGPDGLLSASAPDYKKCPNNTTSFDRIYTIYDKATNLTELASVPVDYAENYNKYFQQPLGKYNYTFRSIDNKEPLGSLPDFPIYSGAEYNVLWSYYMLYRALHTKVTFPEYYIASAYDEYGIDNAGFIPVLDKGELYTNYKYEIDCVLSGNINNYPMTFIGGSWDIGASYPTYPDDTPRNLIICVSEFSFDHNDYLTGFVTANPGYGQSWTEEKMFGTNLIADTDLRQVYTVVDRNYTPPYGPTGDLKRGTTGGFFLLNSKDYRTANTPMYRTGLVNNSVAVLQEKYRKVYRISVYDENDELIMNFIPKIHNGHKGMVDTVDGTFYPCNDDDKFIVGRV